MPVVQTAVQVTSHICCLRHAKVTVKLTVMFRFQWSTERKSAIISVHCFCFSGVDHIWGIYQVYTPLKRGSQCIFYNDLPIAIPTANADCHEYDNPFHK